jgi:hypothetical protein
VQGHVRVATGSGRLPSQGAGIMGPLTALLGRRHRRPRLPPPSCSSPNQLTRNGARESPDSTSGLQALDGSHFVRFVVKTTPSPGAGYPGGRNEWQGRQARQAWQGRQGRRGVFRAKTAEPGWAV